MIRMLVLCVALFTLGTGVSHGQSGDAATTLRVPQHPAAEVLGSTHGTELQGPTSHDAREDSATPMPVETPTLPPAVVIPKSAPMPKTEPADERGSELPATGMGFEPSEICKKNRKWSGCINWCKLNPETPFCKDEDQRVIESNQ